MPKLLIGHAVIEFDYLRNFAIDYEIYRTDSWRTDFPGVELRFRMPVVDKALDKLR